MKNQNFTDMLVNIYYASKLEFLNKNFMIKFFDSYDTFSV